MEEKAAYKRQATPFRRVQENARRENRMGPLAEALQSWRAAKGMSAARVHLDQLWRNWDMVMGAYLAPLALPLGQREEILLIGAEDHYLLHELAYSTPEMLERANAFMGAERFHKVELQLLLGKTPLNRIRSTPYPPPPPPPRPERLGGLLGILDPASPVGRCYAAYVALFSASTRA